MPSLSPIMMRIEREPTPPRPRKLYDQRRTSERASRLPCFVISWHLLSAGMLIFMSVETCRVGGGSAVQVCRRMSLGAFRGRALGGSSESPPMHSKSNLSYTRLMIDRWARNLVRKTTEIVGVSGILLQKILGTTMAIALHATPCLDKLHTAGWSLASRAFNSFSTTNRFLDLGGKQDDRQVLALPAAGRT